jgi:hypothetical protein
MKKGAGRWWWGGVGRKEGGREGGGGARVWSATTPDATSLAAHVHLRILTPAACPPWGYGRVRTVVAAVPKVVRRPEGLGGAEQQLQIQLEAGPVHARKRLPVPRRRAQATPRDSNVRGRGGGGAREGARRVAGEGDHAHGHKGGGGASEGDRHSAAPPNPAHG